MKKRFKLTALVVTFAFILSGCAGGARKGVADIDLTALSSTLVYAEIYNIMQNPDDYIGKTLKLKGSYYSSYYDVTDETYHFVLIADALACCQQGLEFRLSGGSYPVEFSEIEMTGVFGDYIEDGYTYYYLAVDELTA